MATRHESTAQRRGEIARAALEVIAERGVENLTTRAIAEKVGISEGGIFRHFKSKTAIALAAIDELEHLMEGVVISRATTPVEVLEAFFKDRARLVGGAALGHLVFSEQLVHLAGEEGREKVARWRRLNSKLLLDHLTAATARLRLPPEAVSPIVQGALLTIYAERSLRGPIPHLGERIDGLWTTLEGLLFVPEV